MNAQRDWVEDPLFNYRLRFDRKGDVLIIEVRVDPEGGVNLSHFHPDTEERFDVREGEITFTADGETVVARAGDPPVIVPAGVRHTFKNTGTVEGHIVTEAEGGRLDDLQAFLEEAAALSRAGKITKLGIPKPGAVLEAADFADRYRDTVVLTARTFPPPALQPLLLGPLARLRRRRQARKSGSAA
jgi:mannose-6-phosphate isomerase-like protein (cupin superfamily)